MWKYIFVGVVMAKIQNHEINSRTWTQVICRMEANVDNYSQATCDHFGKKKNSKGTEYLGFQQHYIKPSNCAQRPKESHT